jgi:hypothetical protein
VAERDEGFLGVLLGPHDCGLHLGVTAGVAVFGPQAIEDPLGAVTLLGWGLLVGFEDLGDDAQVGPDHRTAPGLGHLIAGRFRIGEDLFEHC